MYDLEQMMETTKIMLKETKRREKALKWILHVLNFAVKQNSRTKISIVLLLNYEKQRQEALVEQLWQQHRLGLCQGGKVPYISPHMPDYVGTRAVVLDFLRG